MKLKMLNDENGKGEGKIRRSLFANLKKISETVTKNLFGVAFREIVGQDGQIRQKHLHTSCMIGGNFKNLSFT